MTPVGSVAGAQVTTIEALSRTREGAAVQAAWLAEEVVQCGYCQSGQLMQAAALLAAEPAPDERLDESVGPHAALTADAGDEEEGISVSDVVVPDRDPVAARDGHTPSTTAM